ncbi:MAG: 3-deoxy-7-phosphoheptulonate synthase [Chloroflexi bacterium]|nr:3-deoxy-7-phosphoheptulonate synthase [Chloroflexota bacterium]
MTGNQQTTTTNTTGNGNGKAYRLVSRASHPADTVVEVNGLRIGDDELVLMAGPCAVESREQLLETAVAVKAAGANVLRGGAYKPRTSPYDFQGLGEKGLRLLAEAREATGLPIITEVMDSEDIDLVAYYADILQIGARNMTSSRLLQRAARTGKPIMLKRGFQATVREWLLSAEYILANGNSRVILCERGIRTHDSEYTRNTLDLNVVPLLRRETHLPIMVDPSHGTGRADLVAPMSRGAVAVGAHGLLIEVHSHPDQALCDGKQSLSTEEFANLAREVRALARAACSLVQALS